MDFAFYIQQGQQLLKKQDAVSVRKALENFKTANEITEYNHIAKPQILYHLAYGNLMIGNIEQAYKIAQKAKQTIPLSQENSVFVNIKIPGEEHIDQLIDFINHEFPQVALFVNSADDDFDENEIDYSNINKLFTNPSKSEIKPQFNPENLSHDVLISTFIGMCRDEDELVYFDIQKADVLSHVQGYFTTLLGDQSISNRRLANRIMNSEPIDYIDEDRYVLIDRILLVDFLSEYATQTKNREPFFTFAKDFETEILEEFDDDDDLVFTNFIQEKFHNLFSKKFENRVSELRNTYGEIFDKTCTKIALDWIKQQIN